MRVSLPFKIKNIGGTATFAQNFSNAARKQGMRVSNKFSSDFDVLFIITDCSLWYPLIAKLLKKKIVQRLDGVYHPATPAGKWYPLYNLKMQIIHNFLADVVIYQSEFSKLSCETFLGKTGALQTAIIYNGVDTDKIPKKTIPRPGDPFPIRLITYAKFRRHDQIEPIIESVKLLDPKRFTLDIYGSYTDNLASLFKNLPENILFQGKKSNEDLLKTLCRYDIFLFSDQSACPNSVLEALAAGLPVVAFDRGSIPELIKPGYNGEVIPLKKDYLSFSHSYPFEKTDINTFAQSIITISGKISYYSKNSMIGRHEHFSLSRMMKEYQDRFIRIN